MLFIAELEPGINDETVLARSKELVFRQGLLHSGILLVRVARLRSDGKAHLVASTVESSLHRLDARIRRSHDARVSRSQAALSWAVFFTFSIDPTAKSAYTDPAT